MNNDKMYIPDNQQSYDILDKNLALGQYSLFAIYNQIKAFEPLSHNLMPHANSIDTFDGEDIQLGQIESFTKKTINIIDQNDDFNDIFYNKNLYIDNGNDDVVLLHNFDVMSILAAKAFNKKGGRSLAPKIKVLPIDDWINIVEKQLLIEQNHDLPKLYNLSYSDEFNTIYNYNTSNDFIHIRSARNFGHLEATSRPSDLPNAIYVGGLVDNLPIHRIGPHISIVAPGRFIGIPQCDFGNMLLMLQNNVYCSYLAGMINSPTIFGQGTSFTTPLITSAVALAQQLAKEKLGRYLYFSEIKYLLIKSTISYSQPYPQVNSLYNNLLKKYYNIILGFGHFQLNEFINGVKEYIKNYNTPPNKYVNYLRNTPIEHNLTKKYTPNETISFNEILGVQNFNQTNNFLINNFTIKVEGNVSYNFQVFFESQTIGTYSLGNVSIMNKESRVKLEPLYFKEITPMDIFTINVNPPLTNDSNISLHYKINGWNIQ